MISEYCERDKFKLVKFLPTGVVRQKILYKLPIYCCRTPIQGQTWDLTLLSCGKKKKEE
jgi:hypothetical protein